jgi:hypothetical protein
MDEFEPNLNMNIFAGSIVGYKHTKETLKKLSSLREGKCYKIINGQKITPQKSDKTLFKLKLHASISKRVNIHSADNNELIKECKTIKEAANLVGLSSSSVSSYIKNNKA